MNWWISQMYEYDPEDLGAVKVAVAPAAMSAVSKVLLAPASVTVCVAGSSLRTVTFAPGATTRVEGWNAKLRMTMVSGAFAPPAVRPDDPHPATTRASARAAEAIAADRLGRGRTVGRGFAPNTSPLRSRIRIGRTFGRKFFSGQSAVTGDTSRSGPATNAVR